MIQVWLVDVPALAWIVGYGTARDPLGRRWGRVVAAAAWPLWIVILTALVTAHAGLWHRDRAAMALVSTPSPPDTAASCTSRCGDHLLILTERRKGESLTARRWSAATDLPTRRQ